MSNRPTILTVYLLTSRHDGRHIELFSSASVDRITGVFTAWRSVKMAADRSDSSKNCSGPL